MNPATLIALQLSIQKWEQNLRYLQEGTPSKCTLGPTSCALCQLFFKYSTKTTCIGCPVQMKTEHIGCGNTPYSGAETTIEAYHYKVDKGWDSDIEKQDAIVATQAEIDFLYSLLPERRKSSV